MKKLGCRQAGYSLAGKMPGKLASELLHANLNARNIFVTFQNDAYNTSLESSFEDLSKDMQYYMTR